ncbi:MULTISPECIES: nucleoside 2-deoxyribosyltransferase [unclassified Streptomyces]|uniref:nucleoside 2-deoxyribosyltransferase n=1 Tax=unclassified Streptomyces TaxID=2593676 RepID=UPI003815B66D
MLDNASEPLANVDIFIGGPIQHAILPDGFAEQLRDAISTAILHVEENGGNVFSAHVAEKFGVDTASFTPDQVSVRDFRWMTKCDVFVPILPVLPDETLLRTDGTHVELGWATALGRPIVMVTKQPFVDSASHLLKGLHQVGDVRVIDFDEFTKNPECLIDNILAATKRTRQVLENGAV